MSEIFWQVSMWSFWHQISWCPASDVKFPTKWCVQKWRISRADRKIWYVWKSPTNEFPIDFQLDSKWIENVSEPKMKRIGLDLAYLRPQAWPPYFRKYCMSRKWILFSTLLWIGAKLQKTLPVREVAKCYLSLSSFGWISTAPVSAIVFIGIILRKCQPWRMYRISCKVRDDIDIVSGASNRKLPRNNSSLNQNTAI